MTDATDTFADIFKDAMVDAAHTLWDPDPNIQISYGHPGMNMLNDIVGFGRVSSEQEVAAYGPTRPREETLTLDVTFSIYRPGGPEMEKVATDRAYELLRQLARYVRITDTTVGGTVRDCFLTAHESDGSTDPETLSQGRLIEVMATFTAHARVRS